MGDERAIHSMSNATKLAGQNVTAATFSMAMSAL
jgi:hypothetical protein